MIFKLGPFTLYRVEKNSTLCVSITALDNWPCGWEYGWEDPAADRKSWIELRLGKLVVFSFEAWQSYEHLFGFEIRILGFWGIR